VSTDIRALKLEIRRPTPQGWVWEISKGKRLLAISAKSYASKAACCKAAYEVQDNLISARVFIDGEEDQ
jgi:hypothetical protein